MNLLFGLLLALFSLAQSLHLWPSHIEDKMELLEKGKRRRQRKQHSCEVFCPRDCAVPYVEQLNLAMTYYIQHKLWRNFTSYTSQTATMEVVTHREVAGCMPPISGCLNPRLIWGKATQYEFIEVGEPKWHKNGVIVIRGKERVREDNEVTFEGESYRYYMAYEGCLYQLEMVTGTDYRCTGCGNCDPNPFNDFDESTLEYCDLWASCYDK